MLPNKLDDIIATQEELARDLTALDAVLSTTVQGGDLESQDFVAVEERLKALFDDHLALDTLPERCRLEHEFQTAGSPNWSRTCTRAVCRWNRWMPNCSWHGGPRCSRTSCGRPRSSPIRMGSALQSAADRFAQVDTEHVRSVGPMVAQESMRRLCEMLFSRTQESNQLHTVPGRQDPHPAQPDTP